MAVPCRFGPFRLECGSSSIGLGASLETRWDFDYSGMLGQAEWDVPFV